MVQLITILCFLLSGCVRVAFEEPSYIISDLTDEEALP